jgi:hypothetical protein
MSALLCDNLKKRMFLQNLFSWEFVRTYAEEEIAKQFPTEREWVYNFVYTEYPEQKSGRFGFGRLQETAFFFQ